MVIIVDLGTAHLRSSSSSGATPNANEQSNATEEALKALLGGLDGSEEDKLVSLKAFVDNLESEITVRNYLFIVYKSCR